MDWTVVVPIKGTVGAKSRLGASDALALAIALDTVAVASSVARVIVVTDSGAARHFARVEVVADPGCGLGAAVQAGIAAAGTGPVAVMLGDLPALQAHELEAALATAEQHPLAMVPDAEGKGTTLIAAIDPHDHTPAFGPGSRAAHGAAGYREIEAGPGLRSDVDTPEQLANLQGRLGPRTAAAVLRAS